MTAELHGTAIPWCADGLYLAERPVFTIDPLYHAGAYYVQEASSMFLSQILHQVGGRKEGLKILDLCAAPGGKSTLIAAQMDNTSLLISNDVIRNRASVLEENMTRWGYANTWVTCNDPRDFTKLTGYFDIILIDAPCSGSGLFRKDNKALNEWSEPNVTLCSARQKRIIADTWPALKEGGTLIYATCSYSPQENEIILDWIKDNYSINPINILIDGDWGITETLSDKNRIPGYRFFPDKVKGEGFFIAAIRKNDETGEFKPAKYKKLNLEKIMAQASYLLKGNDLICIQSGNDNFHAIRSSHEIDWQLLSSLFYFRKAGIILGTPAAREWLPAHDVALSVDAAPELPYIEVTREQALKFLKREEMNLQSMEKGWHIIKFNTLGLGWVKSLGNRVNNYLPKHWRIRMEIPDNEVA